MESQNYKPYNNNNNIGNVHNAKVFTPFDGMFMQRSCNLKNGENCNGYRYGFNGMERDDEWNGTGNAYDFGMMILEKFNESGGSRFHLYCQVPFGTLNREGGSVIDTRHSRALNGPFYY